MSNNQEKNIKKNFNIVTAALLRSLTKKNHHFEFEKIADHNFNNLTLSKSLKLPSPDKTIKIRNVDFLRGRADSLAMNICHHDDVLHKLTNLRERDARQNFGNVQLRVFSHTSTNIEYSRNAFREAAHVF